MVLTARTDIKKIRPLGDEQARWSRLSGAYIRKTVEISRSDHFNIKNVGIQTNEPLRYTY